MKKGVIILGSSNSTGETFKHAQFVSQLTAFSIIDLNKFNILPFDYNFSNTNDDFFNLIEKLTNEFNLLIFATPVYWYTMSGAMKIFFDRISDCLKIYKDTGRKLKGKEMAVISSGSDKNLKHGFHMPFIETAKYLGMLYIGDVHCSDNNTTAENRSKLTNFARVLHVETK